MSCVRLLIVTAALLLASALAQGERFETGTLRSIIGGEERTLSTHGTLVPADAADGVTDPQQRALLERVAGTEQHTATYTLMDEVTMGSIVLVPATLWVALSFSVDVNDTTLPHNVSLQFPLDPASLELSDPDQVEIKYFPAGSSWDDFYALTEGALHIDFVEVVDDVTLRVGGSFEGLMSRQTGYDITHDPHSATEAYGEFVVERVVGSQLALELLEGTP